MVVTQNAKKFYYTISCKRRIWHQEMEEAEIFWLMLCKYFSLCPVSFMNYLDSIKSRMIIQKRATDKHRVLLLKWKLHFR